MRGDDDKCGRKSSAYMIAAEYIQWPKISPIKAPRSRHTSRNFGGKRCVSSKSDALVRVYLASFSRSDMDLGIVNLCMG